MRYSPDRLDLTLALLTALAFATMAFAGAGRGLRLVNGAALTIAAIRGRPIVLDYLDSQFAPALWRPPGCCSS